MLKTSNRLFTTVSTLVCGVRSPFAVGNDGTEERVYVCWLVFKLIVIRAEVSKFSQCFEIKLEMMCKQGHTSVKA